VGNGVTGIIFPLIGKYFLSANPILPNPIKIRHLILCDKIVTNSNLANVRFFLFIAPVSTQASFLRAICETSKYTINIRKMTLITKTIIAASTLTLGSTLATQAGEDKSVIEPPKPASFSSCDALKNLGKIYKNNDNPYIQEWKIFGRMHYQTGSISGEGADGGSFHDNFDTFRRMRIGTSLKFAQYFKAVFRTQLVADSRYKGGELNWGIPEKEWASFDEVFLRFNAKKAFNIDGLDKLDITYGRQKFLMSAEAHESSKRIKTIERSAIANTVYLGALPVGLTISGKKGSWAVNGSIYSDTWAETRADSVFGDWSGGEGYLLNVIKTLDNNDEIIFDYLYHNDDNGPGKNDFFFNKKWAVSLAYQGERGPWGFMVNVIGGDHGKQDKKSREGAFYGAVAQGTYWLIDDKLEAVGMYQWQGSTEEEGVVAYSKDFAASGGHGGDVNKGRGDSHHMLYAGVNWYLCGDHSKIMLGVEYDNLDTPKGNANATTLWAAYRLYF